MLKNKYQRMSKEERKNLREEYYQTKYGRQNKSRFLRVIIISVFCLFYSIYMGIENYLDKKAIMMFIYCIGLFITGMVMLIACIRIRNQALNNYALKKKEK
jgi:hypothetical protein